MDIVSSFKIISENMAKLYSTGDYFTKPKLNDSALSKNTVKIKMFHKKR